MGDVINVFVVDDSAIVRTTISKLLESETDINIMGTASDPIIAQEKFQRNGKPDVIILDIEMPRMDGLTFLRKIMAEHPIPVIICSSIAQEGSSNAIEALFLGAVEIIAKPDVGVKSFLEESRAWLIHAIHAAYRSKSSLKPRPLLQQNKKQENTKLDTDVVLKLKNQHHKSTTHSVVAIGASTGGVQTLEKILSSIPEKTAPILITQHMPPGFTKSLAHRLNMMSSISVKEAVHGDKLLHGRALIAPGDKHMLLKRSGNSYIVEIKDGPRVSRHKPSVDVLFRSCANEAGANAIGLILTGMGDDGAKGLKEMRECGAKTYSQNEDSCIVYGMPKIAMEIGASMGALSLKQIIDIIKKG